VYYRLYIQYYQQEHNYLEVCRCYRAIYDTPSVLKDAQQWQSVRTSSLRLLFVRFLFARSPWRCTWMTGCFSSVHAGTAHAKVPHPVA